MALQRAAETSREQVESQDRHHQDGRRRVGDLVHEVAQSL